MLLIACIGSHEVFSTVFLHSDINTLAKYTHDSCINVPLAAAPVAALGV